MDETVNSSLLEDIDFKATAINVDSFFKNSVRRLLQMANDQDLLHISSPRMDGMPMNHDNCNHATEGIDRVTQAAYVCQKIAETIGHCSQSSQTILIKKYVKREQDMWIAQELHISDTKYSDLKKWALNEFADRFQSTKCREELHVY